MAKLAQLWLTCLFVFWLSACAQNTTNSYAVPEVPSSLLGSVYQPQVSKLSIKAYSFMLADELLQPLANNQLNGNVVVTRFVQQDSRLDKLDTSHPLTHLGGQLEESFIYELNKRGYKVTDFKLRPEIEVTQQGDLIWSRDLKQLKQNIDARYVVAGTFTPHQNGAVVNVRMLDISNGSVLATAQGFFPNNLFWSQESVTTRDGMLMHKGEPDRVVGEDRETYF